MRTSERIVVYSLIAFLAGWLYLVDRQVTLIEDGQDTLFNAVYWLITQAKKQFI